MLKGGDKMPETNLEECLAYFGCDKNETAEILKCHENGNIKGMIQLLRKRRQAILNTIHAEEKQISCLDYLVFQIEKDSQTK